MNIQSISSNSASFGAKIKFENSKLRETVPNITDYKYAKNVLDRFEAYHPKDTVIIKMVTAANQNNSYMEAVNQLTHKSMKHRLLLSDFDKDFESSSKSVSGSNTFYALLESLLDENSSAHNIFWGNSMKYGLEPGINEHSVFNA